VSVREEPLREYLEELTGRKVERHIDPTLLLDRDAWREISETPPGLEGQYIFFYRVAQQPALNRAAEGLSEALGIPVFAADRNDTFARQIERSGFLSPEQWIGALDQAAYVVTNSFHGAAFSVNFHKRALVMPPLQGGARIDDFLSRFGLERLRELEPIRPDETDALYLEADRVLALERAGAFQYLRHLGE
jgi:hypothetical protein